MKYRKKAVDIEARKINMANIDQIADWCGGMVDRREDNYKPTIKILTLEGVMRANLDDWVIKGVAGEFYPCRDDIFQKTYEKVDG